MDKKHMNQLKKAFDHHHGVSQRQVAQRFDCVQLYISKILKNKTNIRYYKKKTIPHQSESQLARIKLLCRHIYRNFWNFDFVLDDKSYFTYANTTLAGNDGFYSSDVSSTTSDVKFKRKKKYEKKVLVSLIISPKGTSKRIFFESGQVINKQAYIRCRRKRLIHFIDKHYKNEEYLFWADLASSHYANEVVFFLDANNIKYLPKVKNSPNLPEARPIEDFWGQLKRLVYEDNWQATSIPQLKRRIVNCLNKMDPEVAKCYASMTSVRLGRIAFNDVIENQ
ncbi:uncharacterized protein LOC136085346 [Hydra vulgaris]|uniref:Uncharacterized protein LOC136085346 n=1 Tax=Hydra vulgaris TaxID=6087 RepID=A0ABM4CLQ2_HYDVU